MTRFVFALAIAALPLAAQTSSLKGTVTDAQGAAIPAAVVTAVNKDTSAVRKTVSDATGAYSMLQMAPGPYKVTIEKPSFRSSSTDVVLQTETPATLNMKLEIGQVTETVNVTGEAAVVNTENAAVGNPFNETQVREIPLQTRNVVQLLSVEPGVSASGQVAGARPDQNNVTLDGADVNYAWGGSNANGFNASIPIPLDSVQEFRTTVVGLNADQGYSSGGQVSVVTKGGSNSFHGSAYEYNRNTLTSANTWGNNYTGAKRPALVRNQFGASLGGPIVKNRLFFFYNYEGRTDRSAAAELAQVPSPLFSQGIVQVQLKGSNQVVQLGPAAVQAIDPLGIGENPYVLGLMKQYPAGNAPASGSDKGLNFYGLTFNAANAQNYHTQVARLDYNIDSAGKHTLMVAGTLNGQSLAGNGNGGGLAQFPGQASAQESLDNSRRLASRYTWVISPHLVNALNYGYNRFSEAATGNTTTYPTFGFTALTSTPRASRTLQPLHNINDDLTWTHGRHTAAFGISFRFSQYTSLSYNNVESFTFNRNTLLGLGNDIDNAVTAYIQQNIAPGATLANNTYVTNAFGAMFGMLNNWAATFHYLVNGQTIPFGQPFGTNFVDHEYEAYAQDAFKITRNFTVTYGLRYSLYGVPYEKNGQQVVPQTPLSNYFGQRVWAQANGVPNSSLPDSKVTYAIGGPVNNGPGYYPLDPKLFAPRLALAWSPDSGSVLEQIFGKGSVLRAGGAMIYDHYGAAMSEAFSTGGSPGLATTVAQPVNTNFSSTFRYNGSALPNLAAPAPFTFPYTPPTIIGGFTTFTGIQTDLKAPYEYVLNATYARPLTKGLSLELGYVGRMGHRQIVQQDFGQPLENFKDPKSGQTLSQAGAALANVYNGMIASGMSPSQASAAVKANPSLVPAQPFIENVFPGIKNYLINGSPSANFFYDWYNGFSGSFTDTVNDMDRTRQSRAGGGCFSIYGCNTFFPLQNSGLPSYTNAGYSNYNAATVVLRRTVQHGWGFDFNYTFGHALDNGSSSESSGGAALQDAFNPRAYYGPSDFDARHTITFDYVVELPIGPGKALWNSMPKLVSYALGGWQISGLTSFHTGLPLTISDSGVYNTNYDYSSFAILSPGIKMPGNGPTTDQNGIPSLFSNTGAVNNFIASNPGTVGTRGIIRGFKYFNTDLAVSKYIPIKERYRVQLRAEAFNAFNNVNFNNAALNLNIASPTNFGELGFSSSTNPPALAARVMQFAARFEF